MDHSADDRARPDDRDLHDDVVEGLRRVARQRGHLRAALDLEEADRVRRVQHPVDRGVVRRQVREVHLDLLVRPDHRDRLFERGEHAEAEHVEQQTGQYELDRTPSPIVTADGVAIASASRASATSGPVTRNLALGEPGRIANENRPRARRTSTRVRALRGTCRWLGATMGT